eukprot:CCRYP_005692-RA/>CCRYP_005692-RA protein AED:0.28 eAED:0.28 QI:1768/1/1/1/0.5/1/3/1712/180
MQFYLTIAATVVIFAQGSVSHELKIPNLRAYADEVQRGSNRNSCQLPAEVAGSIEMTGCSKVFYFEKMPGTNTQCIRNGGSSRTNGSFSDISSAEDCANKCVEDESKVRNIVGMNYSCETKTCQCLFGTGMVEGTRTRRGSTCYAVTSAISGTTPLPKGQKMSRHCDERSVVELITQELN